VKRAFRLAASIILALATTIAGQAVADDYPNKPIKVISDSAPGSAVDVTFRMTMDRLGAVLGQQIVPIDQPGAGGAIAARAASDAIPDGYTLFAPALSLFISLPGKAENLPLRLPRDFLAVGSLAQLSVFICASPQSGIKTLPDLITRAKASRRNLICSNPNRTNNPSDRTAPAKQGRHQMLCRALFWRPDRRFDRCNRRTRASDHRRLFGPCRRYSGAQC
jgi:tripartite-type tricarboxylate transporter receptor subunit TctC